MAESEKEKLVWQLPPWVDPAPWWWFQRWEDVPVPIDSSEYVIPITFPDKANKYAIPIGFPKSYARLVSTETVPFQIPGAGYVMTPVIPVPAPGPWWYMQFADVPWPVPREYRENMDEGQKKALAKMQLDLQIDLINAELKLFNSLAQKHMDMLKRVVEMMAQREI
jgi:hypothetical protein